MTMAYLKQIMVRLTEVIESDYI